MNQAKSIGSTPHPQPLSLPHAGQANAAERVAGRRQPPGMDAMVVRVSVSMPWAPGQMFCEEFVVSAGVCRESFAPLPRGRELPFYPHEAAQAREQQDNRRELANKLADGMAEIILRTVEGRDPHHGYSPEQWADIIKGIKSPTNKVS